MNENVSARRVEVRFVGALPLQHIERASGVSDVEADDALVRCLVSGSFQSFLEALRGHEVVGLTSTPESGPTPQQKGTRS
jgi:hypothetical protein